LGEVRKELHVHKGRRNNDRHTDLTSTPVVRSIKGDVPNRITAKALFALLVRSRLLCCSSLERKC
jgi:hypothetical protein